MMAPAERLSQSPGDSHFQSRITSIGLTIGSRIEVIQNPKKQPVLLYNRDTMVALNKNEAEKNHGGGEVIMAEKTIALLGSLILENQLFLTD